MCRADNAALKNALRPLEPYLELTGTNEVIVNREHEVVLEGLSGWELRIRNGLPEGERFYRSALVFYNALILLS